MAELLIPSGGTPSGATPDVFCPTCGGTLPTCCRCPIRPSPAHVLYAELAMLVGWLRAGIVGSGEFARADAVLAYARESGIEVPMVEGATPAILAGFDGLFYDWNQRA